MVWHVACAQRDNTGVRRLYAAGSGNLYASMDGGLSWRMDNGTAVIRSTVGGLAGATADNSGSGASVLVVDPANPKGVFLAAVGGANGPSYYAQRSDGSLIPDGTICNATSDRGCGEGSIWYGDYTGFDQGNAARWTQLPGPPVYWGATSPSGNSFVTTQVTGVGYLLFFADESHVHVSAERRPAPPRGGTFSTARTRHERRSRTTSTTACSSIPIPHALAVSANFIITLKAPAGVTAPYNQNSVLDRHLGGTIWMANDGGVYWSADGGATWTASSGLETLDAVNIAGLAGLGPQPALYLGTGDNDDFFSLDGGQTWRDPNTGCGDCDAWFADLAQATRVLQFDPRGAGLRVRSANGYPDATSNSQTRNVKPPTQSNASSGAVIRGFRPLVRTLATEAAPADGDCVFTGMRTSGARVLFRTLHISSITNAIDWEDTAKAQQVGPTLPAGVDVVQVAGGHAAPVFYVSDNTTLYKLNPSGTQWVQIAPGGPAGQAVGKARRFYANPFDARIVYVVDDTAVRVSVNGGASWQIADSLTRAVTAGGRMTLNPATVVNDMLFVRSDPFTAFVLGHAGVSYTNDGVEWRLLLSAVAQPGVPEFAFFDGISNPNERALYITLTGRGVQKISPILPRTSSQPRDFSALEFAAAIADA